MENKNFLRKKEKIALVVYYNWLLKGTQRGKVLTVLEVPMITSRIRDVIKKRFPNNVITQRSVGRIVKSLKKVGLVKEIRHNIDGLGRIYETTSIGKKMQGLLRENEYRGIWS